MILKREIKIFIDQILNRQLLNYSNAKSNTIYYITKSEFTFQ